MFLLIEAFLADNIDNVQFLVLLGG